MKLKAGIANVDITKELEYVVDRIKLGIMDSPVADEEAEDILKGVSVAKRITSMLILGLRPALFFKEMSIGLYKAAALSSTKMYGKQQFGQKSMLTAMTKIGAIDKKAKLE